MLFRSGLKDSGVPHEFIDLQYPAERDLKAAILEVCDRAEAAVRAGKLVLLLSDRYLVRDKSVPSSAALRSKIRSGMGRVEPFGA